MALRNSSDPRKSDPQHLADPPPTEKSCINYWPSPLKSILFYFSPRIFLFPSTPFYLPFLSYRLFYHMILWKLRIAQMRFPLLLPILLVQNIYNMNLKSGLKQVIGCQQWGTQISSIQFYLFFYIIHKSPCLILIFPMLSWIYLTKLVYQDQG